MGDLTIEKQILLTEMTAVLYFLIHRDFLLYKPEFTQTDNKNNRISQRSGCFFQEYLQLEIKKHIAFEPRNIFNNIWIRIWLFH